MVQGIENLSLIRGRVLARRPHPRLADWDVIELALEAAETVPDKINLLASQVGKTIDLAVRRAALGATGPGGRLRCRAKRTVEGAMCEPDPAPGDFELSES